MKITLHRAIAEIKSTNDRLDKLTTCGTFVAIKNKATGLSAGGRKIDAVEKEIVGYFDKFNALYDNLTKLKFALVGANSGIKSHDDLMTEEVCGNQYTILEILALKQIVKHKAGLLTRLKVDFANAKADIERRMEAEDSKLQKTIAQLNNNDADNKEVTIDMITKTYWQSNGFELIDPIHIEELIERLEKETCAYEVGIDAALSQANALRTIEVDIAE